MRSRIRARLGLRHGRPELEWQPEDLVFQQSHPRVAGRRIISAGRRNKDSAPEIGGQPQKPAAVRVNGGRQPFSAKAIFGCVCSPPLRSTLGIAGEPFVQSVTQEGPRAALNAPTLAGGFLNLP